MNSKSGDLTDIPKETLSYKILFYISIPMMVVALYLAFVWTPVEAVMGVVQKIFYFHVASAWVAFFSFFVVALFSILYLIKRNRIFDLYAGVSAEIGVVYTAIVLTTGPIWGRSSWNAWWSWEPRLTTTLIMFFMYIAYIMIRKMEGPWEKKARLASVFGIISVINVPIVFMSIRWWNSRLHPVVFGEGANEVGGGIEPSMLFALIFSVFTMTVLYFVLLQKGVYIEKLKIHADRIKERMQEKMLG
ncbi:cytochrome C assembly protein [Anaerobacillus alkalidiazotrophicus]|uniref:Heme exporter protein C n=1 Tax=Anaerobacillus alkalidiazotrophicus TaxID=472963 RepID=A0A1S2M7F2_9BACI|nr:cytochrome c biogenesis protein CcsA [Anaerobacillus alkalidiazotrophicus]OIJ20400.1 cytochrome C assembly protein [Anaerobacillus alkalidiazotrophicus]